MPPTGQSRDLIPHSWCQGFRVGSFSEDTSPLLVSLSGFTSAAARPASSGVGSALAWGSALTSASALTWRSALIPPFQTFAAPSFDDKILEVVAVFGSMQMAVSRVIKLQHHRIAQVPAMVLEAGGTGEMLGRLDVAQRLHHP